MEFYCPARLNPEAVRGWVSQKKNGSLVFLQHLFHSLVNEPTSMFRPKLRFLGSVHVRPNVFPSPARLLHIPTIMTKSSHIPTPAQPASPSQPHQESLSEPRSGTPPVSQRTRIERPRTDPVENLQDISESIRDLKVNISSPSAQSTTNPKPNKKSKGKRSRKMDGREGKVEPSAESGGTPVTSIAYVKNSLGPANRISVPQHLLVVIDLNGTILYRPNRKEPQRFIARPHALRFLQYCIDTFSVVIWSSARPENVMYLIDAILPPALKQRCIAIWGREKFNLSKSDYARRVMCYKRLTTIWKDPQIARSHPEFQYGANWDQTNTVLVDDSVEKGQSEPYNLIRIPEYFGNEHEKGEILPQVHDYLNQLSLHDNVSAYMRSMPFSALAGPAGPPGSGPPDPRALQL